MNDLANHEADGPINDPHGIDAEAAEQPRSRLRVLLAWLGWLLAIAAAVALLAAMLGFWVGERPTLVPAEQAAALIAIALAGT